ncbi:hypothetical protein ACSXAY_17760 (plasmid) [Clostridium perfringens]
MKRKLLSTVIAFAMTASITMPVFAAQNTQDATIPVTGKVGRWQSGPTDPNNPGGPGSGGQGQDGEINPPSNITDINVTVPTSMTFNVVTNTSNSNPELVTAEYTVTNNGAKAITMSGQYDVTNAGDITLVDTSAITSKGGDGKIELGLSLNSGTTGAVNTPFIENVTNGASSGQAVDINNGDSTYLKFDSTAQGMSDVKAEALKGTFKNVTKTTTGNLVLTFSEK